MKTNRKELEKMIISLNSIRAYLKFEKYDQEDENIIQLCKIRGYLKNLYKNRLHRENIKRKR